MSACRCTDAKWRSTNSRAWRPSANESDRAGNPAEQQQRCGPPRAPRQHCERHQRQIGQHRHQHGERRRGDEHRDAEARVRGQQVADRRRELARQQQRNGEQRHHAQPRPNGRQQIAPGQRVSQRSQGDVSLPSRRSATLDARTGAAKRPPRIGLCRSAGGALEGEAPKALRGWSTSVRHQHRNRHLPQQAARRAAEHALGPTRMPVRAHHDQVGAGIGRQR